MSHVSPHLKTSAGDRVAVASRSTSPLRCDRRPASTTPRADEARARGNLSTAARIGEKLSQALLSDWCAVLAVFGAIVAVVVLL